MKTSITNKIYIYIPDEEIYYEKKKKYVLQIIVPQPEGSVGGSDTHVLELSKQQKKSSILAPIVLFKRNREYENKLLNYKIAYISGINCTDIEIAEALENINEYITIACIHSHQYDANFLTQVIKENCKALMKTPTVMTCHGWIENTEHDIQETIKDFNSYYCADALITVCKKDKNRLNSDKRYKDKKIYCINNGVKIPVNKNINEKICLFRKTYGIPNNARIIAFVGRLAYEKRVDLIIETFQQLLMRQDNIYLLIVGSGNEYNNLQTIINKLQIKNKVIFTGYLENPFIVYATMEFLLLMSETEGTPRCVLESMSCGKIAVATNVGGVSEIINSGTDGIIINSNNVHEWSKVINRLLNNKNLVNQMNINAKDKIINDFSILKMCKEIDTVYFSIGV